MVKKGLLFCKKEGLSFFSTLSFFLAKRPILPLRAARCRAVRPAARHVRAPITCETVTTLAGFLALEPEWQDLWARTDRPRFSQNFAWFRAGWETTGQKRCRQINILVVRHHGRAVLIWPLCLRRKWFWRLGTALGPEITEYDPVLVAAGPGADGQGEADYIRIAWAHLRKRSGADVIAAQHVRANTPMRCVLASAAGQRSTETLPAPYIDWHGIPSWDAYMRGLSKNTRSGVTRRARRLAERGTVWFGIIDDPHEFAAVLAWTLRTKIGWMTASGLDNDFIRTPEFPDFLKKLHAASGPGGRLLMFALKLDGRVIASKICTLDAHRLEAFITAYDGEFASYSLGSIALVECLKWCMDRGVGYDFRFGDEAYKREWATGDCPSTSTTIATTPWGRAYLALSALLGVIRRAKGGLRTRLPPDLRRRLKRLRQLSCVSQGA